VDRARRVVIGLGSNLGDRAGYIRSAIESFAASPELRVIARSPVYESPPAGGPSQGDYLNAALLLRTSLPARALLDRALAVERSLGRIRKNAERWGPRTIDIDLLWIEAEVIVEPELEVPHPRLRERNFALRPLLDVAPDAIDPRTGEPYSAVPAAHVPIERFDRQEGSGLSTP
jgi:2-amino-4-hydroxy-6-hydroxymethyldihydropteridine diphosphokinase